MEQPKISDIDLRNKLVLNCPKLMQQAGFSKIDFGSAFLDPISEETVSQTQTLLNDSITIANNAGTNLSADQLTEGINEALKFIQQDLVTSLYDYANGLFKTYISVDYAASLTGDLVKSTAYYTTMFTKTPSEILTELKSDPENSAKENQESEKKEKINDTLESAKTSYTNTLRKINDVTNKILPYVDEIKKYSIYGKDRVTTELIALYKKYYNMGIGIIDSQIGEVVQLINTSIDYVALVSGKFAAEQINAAQRRVIKKQLNKENAEVSKAKIKALAAINKTTLNLLALVGG